MSIELTARLTLSSCVSQLTDFYSTTLVHHIANEGLQDVRVVLCSNEGEVYPYQLHFKVFKDAIFPWLLGSLVAQVVHITPNEDDFPDEEIIFSSSLKAMKNIATTFKCALHVCGDFIKFNEKQERI